MIRLYQKEWHGIKFNSFTLCDKNNIANEEFYDKFYTNFFKKYKNFDDLDGAWITYKETVANQLLKEIKDTKNILSIGCGIGIVEKYLINHRKDINLTAIEPSQNAIRWINEIDRLTLIKGYFPECIANRNFFDLAYANAIDYVFNDEEYIKFLKSIIDYGIKKLIIISVSFYEPSYKIFIKESTKDILSAIGLYDRYQFWGYMRTVNEQTELLLKYGFDNVELLYKDNGTIFIKATIEEEIDI